MQWTNEQLYRSMSPVIVVLWLSSHIFIYASSHRLCDEWVKSHDFNSLVVTSMLLTRHAHIYSPEFLNEPATYVHTPFDTQHMTSIHWRPGIGQCTLFLQHNCCLSLHLSFYGVMHVIILPSYAILLHGCFLACFYTFWHLHSEVLGVCNRMFTTVLFHSNCAIWTNSFNDCTHSTSSQCPPNSSGTNHLGYSVVPAVLHDTRHDVIQHI